MSVSNQEGETVEVQFKYEDVYIERGQFQALGPPPARELLDFVDLESKSIVISRDVKERVVQTEKEYLVSFTADLPITHHRNLGSLSRISAGDDSSDDEETVDQRGEARSRSRSSSSSLSSIAKALGENVFGWYKKSDPSAEMEPEKRPVGRRTVNVVCDSEDKATSLLETLNMEVGRITERQDMEGPRTQLGKGAVLESPVVNGKTRGSMNTPSPSPYPPLSRSSPVTDSEDSVNYIERERQIYHWLQLSKWKSTDEGILPDSIMFPLREEGGIVTDESSSPFSLSNKSHLTSDTVCFMTSAKCKGEVSGDALLSTILRMDFINHLSPFRSFEVLSEIEPGVELVRIVLNDISQGDEDKGDNSDIVVRRSSRQMGDGAVVVCLDSASAEDSPPPVPEGCRRRLLNAAYVIEESANMPTQLTFVCDLDVKGLTSSEGKDEVLGMRRHVESILEASSVVQGSVSPMAAAKKKSKTKSRGKWWSSSESSSSTASSSSSVVQSESKEGRDKDDGKGKAGGMSSLAERTFYNTPYPATCPAVMSREPEASSFNVRGATYLKDGVKVPSAPHVLKLCCVDLFRTAESTQNVCSRADNRVYQAAQRGESDWYFVLNIMVPVKKSRIFSYVVYWTGDKAKLAESGPFGNVARRFFNDGDDMFRNSCFKLIPKIVDGPTLVKMAVKDKPTLLGNKLTQYYHRGDNYFEVDVDVSSSVIAYNTVGMCLGVSEKLIVDMGIVLQGNEEEELPEVMLASVTGVHLDVSLAKDL